MVLSTIADIGDLHKRRQITAIALARLGATETVVVALSGLDGVLMLYDVQTNIELTRCQAVKPVTSIAFDHYGGQLAYGTHEGDIVISSVQTQRAVELFPRSQYREVARIENLGFHPKLDTLFYAVTLSEVVVRRLSGLVLLRHSIQDFMTSGDNFPCICSQMFHPVRNEFLICTRHDILVYDLSTMEVQCIVIGLGGIAASYSPCGNYILELHRDPDYIWVWDNC